MEHKEEKKNQEKNYLRVKSSFEMSGSAIFNIGAKDEEKLKHSVSYESSKAFAPSSTSFVTDLIDRTKTIRNTFLLSERPDYRDKSFKLYQETISNRANEL